MHTYIGMFFTLLVDYVRWHYGEALVHYLRILKTWWWFVAAYFSVPLLLATLFSPFKRTYERGVEGDKLGAYLEHFIINVLSRLLGAVIRLSLIATAFVLMCFLTIGGIFGYALWLILPGVPALMTGVGLFLLVSSFLGI